MKTVHVVVDDSRVVDFLTTPMRLARRRLAERGMGVSFHSDLSERTLACDILILISKPVFRLLGERQSPLDASAPTFQLLDDARSGASKVVWLDSADSTGATHFEVLPHVDLYLKGQLLKDRSLYGRSFYGGRIFSDFYHDQFGIEDEVEYGPQHPLDESLADKVGLAWNIGLGDVFSGFSGWSKLRGRLRRRVPFLPLPRSRPRPVDPSSGRSVDVFLRCSTDWSRESVVFHRRELVRRLENLMATRTDVDGSVRGRVSAAEYLRTMSRSKLAFGPFGWGELNAREYEALMLGCALLRPDMTHMETWPDIFRDGETCVFYRWDFQDLETKVLDLLEDDELRQGIAAAGQQAFMDSVSDEGLDAFSDWFVRQVTS